jgi:acyl carrier protein
MPDMDDAGIRAALKDALAKTLNREIPDLTEQMQLFGDLALDSTGVIELLMTLEDSIGLQIDPDELTPEVFETVGTLTGYIAASLAPVG